MPRLARIDVANLTDEQRRVLGDVLGAAIEPGQSISIDLGGDIAGSGEFALALEREKLAALAEFSAGAGHEINNPLAVISGRAQLLLEDERHPERRRDLATIHAQARRVHEMILDLMLFARPPAPRLAAHDLRDVVDAVVGEASEQAQARNVALSWKRDQTHLPALIDETQIAAALKAVIDNAIEASPKGGVVTIEASGEGESVRVAVADQGPGIAPEVRRHMFDPYFSGRSAGRGLGLGLSKCWRIVTNHGGTVAAESTASGGAKFVVTLSKASA